MKKFFTLCLAFMLALLYNANAAETGWNTYVSVSPAEGKVSELSTITLTFEHGVFKGYMTTISGVTLEKPDGSSVSCSAFGQGHNGNNVNVFVEPACTEPGVYKLNIPAGAMQAGMNGPTNGEMNLQWTIASSSTTLEQAEITLNGVMKDANTVYYHGSLANPTVKVALPEGASYMDVEVTNSGTVTESRKDQTADCTIQFTSAGNYTVTATAYSESGASSVASKDIAIETVSGVYTFDELINKGEGAIGALNFMPTVVAHIGKYLYLEGYDSWEDIRTSALVYASLDKTYKKGDVLENFIATVAYDNGNPQLIPLTTSLGDPRGLVEPYVYEFEAGDAWTAFATVANANKYVRVKNATLTADAVAGVMVDTNTLGIAMPYDLTKNYDVVGFLCVNNGTVQFRPISFTKIGGETIEPFTYTEIVPANNAEVPSLSEIKITFPYNVTYDATVAMGVLVMDGGKTITPTVAVEGAVATLTFDAITAYGSKPSLMVKEGAFKEATSGVGCQQIMAAWSIPTPPVRADYMPINIDPADGSVVESIKNIYFYFDDENPCVTDPKGYNAAYFGYVTVKDGNGNAVASNVELDVKKVSGQWVGLLQPKKGSSYTEPGTYVITLAEGLFSDQQYYDENGKKGRVNPEFSITYTIKSASLAAPTVSPANGAEIESPSTITLTFAEAVTANAEAGAITLVRNSDASADKQDAVVTISEDGLTATLTCKPVYPSYEPKWYVGETYTMSIPAGYFVNASGAANEALSYSWKLVAPKFNVTKTTPEVGEVEQLDVIKIYFSEKVYLNNSNPINILNEAGEVATTATVKRGGAWVGEVFESWIEATLAQPITTPGQYTLVVPDGLAKNVEWGEGAINAATNLTYTVTGVVVDPNTYTLEYNVSPAAREVTELSKLEFTPITEGLIYMPTDEAQVANWVKVTDANGNVYNTTAKGGRGYEVNIEGVTEPGTYTVVVPKGSFYDFKASMSNPNSKNFNDEIVLTYTLKAAPAVDDFTPIVNPAAGNVTIDQIKKTVITLPSKFASFDSSCDPWYDQMYIKRYEFGSEKCFWSKTMGDITVSEDGLTITIDWTNPTFVEGTEYTFCIPAGYIVLENGSKNVATEVPYTLVAPTPDDFTPVVTPAAGNVTAEQIKKTVITLPSKFASFDSSCDPWYDQMYIKRYEFGSEKCFWSKTMGNITVSEDGLTITIDWTNPTFVEGTEYTFCIPAGYIVLENGAKNLATEVAYTLAATALAAPTVSPANDTEVENLNTITLTFAEAVTANAEAGAISIVNTSDPNYDYAKEIRVAISEDGLTATITCVPGYLDRWAPGKTYKLNIPAGYFVATSGAASEAIEYSWTIATPKFTYVAVDPAQGEVTELSEILISFAQKTWGNGSNPTLNLVDANGNVVTTASTNREKDANGNWFAIKATLKDKVTTPGTYKLVVPADVLRDEYSTTTNAAFDLTWTVLEPDPNTYDLALTSDPANGATVTELKTIKISAADASVIAMPTTEAQSAGWFTIKDAEGNSYNYTAKVGVGIEINIEGATALGTYTVVVPAKSFVDAMTMTAASKRYNAEMILTYTLQEEEEVDNTVYDLTPVTISPANGTEVETLDVVYVQFPENVYDCLWGALDYSKDFVKVSDDKGNTYEAKLNKGEYSDEYYIYVKDATQPGTYTIVVPKALVFDAEYADTFESGHANPEFTLTYTIVAPQVDDFTPVINPTAGNVTKEQIKTTVLSFESPIASFDDSDVRYAKPAFGSVWCSVAGRYTIAEDKLSLTINWDFSPEVGLDYTLELPAGCIVLENGAKNLFTQVKYTVVGGPKDLAEFVVPEGINGYINYDETDVNAWAPEFPFTVSTSAINTIQFTAELPSLPAGITAMEVIDENGEVIATLNQDGVAPLADGEIYYVKGETTKEYADGAELKFRFRFTHLGVSETIQFSYKVAGGNITSIADVELDGNVIVRGNDIIAPEGAAIFTVSGIRVPAEGLAPGVYVVVLGNQAVKVMVK